MRVKGKWTRNRRREEGMRSRDLFKEASFWAFPIIDVASQRPLPQGDGKGSEQKAEQAKLLPSPPSLFLTLILCSGCCWVQTKLKENCQGLPLGRNLPRSLGAFFGRHNHPVLPFWLLVPVVVVLTTPIVHPLCSLCLRRVSMIFSFCVFELFSLLSWKRFFLFVFLVSHLWRNDRLLCMCFFKLVVIVVDVRGLCFVCLSLLFLCVCVSHCLDLVLSSHFAFESICGLNVIIGYLI